jgi:hypothetical protein
MFFSPKVHFTSRNSVLNLYYSPVRVQNVRGNFNFGITKYCFNAALKFNSLRIKLSLLILIGDWGGVVVKALYY